MRSLRNEIILSSRDPSHSLNQAGKNVGEGNMAAGAREELAKCAVCASNLAVEKCLNQREYIKKKLSVIT